MGINGIIVIICSIVVILITISVILYIVYATNKEKEEVSLPSYLKNLDAKNSIQDIQITF